MPGPGRAAARPVEAAVWASATSCTRADTPHHGPHRGPWHASFTSSCIVSHEPVVVSQTSPSGQPLHATPQATHKLKYVDPAVRRNRLPRPPALGAPVRVSTRCARTLTLSIGCASDLLQVSGGACEPDPIPVEWVDLKTGTGEADGVWPVGRTAWHASCMPMLSCRRRRACWRTPARVPYFW